MGGKNHYLLTPSDFSSLSLSLSRVNECGRGQEGDVCNLKELEGEEENEIK